MNQHVIYGVNGVCKVESVSSQKLYADQPTQDYYILRPVCEPNSKIFVPVDNEKLTAQIHALPSKEQIDQIILEAHSTKMPWGRDYRKRIEDFRSIFSRRNEKEMLQMISCLYLHSKEKGSTAVNARMLTAAQRVIDQEFSFSLGIKPEDVAKYIQTIIGLKKVEQETANTTTKRRFPIMKRIKSACLLQTIHFQLNEAINHTMAVQNVKAEYEFYKRQLQQKNTKYQILDETEQPDGSLIIHIKKQYNTQNCDEYFS